MPTDDLLARARRAAGLADRETGELMRALSSRRSCGVRPRGRVVTSRR